MIGKIVLTEKGLLFSNELLTFNPNDPPPFLEEGKPIQKGVSTPKLANLYENSNGFLDRVTLKSAQSNRVQNTNKPFFLPNCDVKEIQNRYPPIKGSKYPGIYPPKSQIDNRNGKNNNLQIQQQTSTQSLQQGGTLFKDIPQHLQGMSSMPGSHPLVLDYDSLINQQYDTSSNRNNRTSNFQSISSKTNVQQAGDEGNFPFESKQKRYSQGIITQQSHQVNGINHQMALFQDSPTKKDNLNKFQFSMTTKANEMLKGTISPMNKNSLNIVYPGQRRPVNKEEYLQSIKNRMDLKKQAYQHKRDEQEKILKDIAHKRANLSKDPVHIAAKFLQELKKEDNVVENLIYDVNFCKTRYKNRLQEYHHQKYQKQWNQLQLPSEKKKDPSPKRLLKDDLLNDDLDYVDNYQLKVGQKSNRKLNSNNSLSQNI